MAIYINLFLVLLIISCKKDFKESEIDSSFKNVQRIVSNSCIECHKDYNISNEENFLKLGLVVPGDPLKSRLYKTINYPNLTLKQMPPEEKIPWNDVLSIKYWIQELKDNEADTDNQYQAKTLTGKAFFQRCFSHLTGSLPSQEIIDKITTKQKALSFCERILNEAKLSLNSKTVESDLSKNILNNFNRLHLSFFIPFDFFRANQDWGTQEIVDQYGPALYFNLAVFDDDFKFNDIFKSQKHLEGIRKSESRNDYYSSFVHGERYKIEGTEWRLGDDMDVNIPWSPSLIERGSLVGIREVEKNRSQLKAYVPGHRFVKSVKESVNIYEHFGGGVLGSQQYLLAYGDRDLGVFADGKVRLDRGWSKSVISNFLCRDLPVVKQDDVKLLINPKSDLSFKRKNNCMMCHYTMDNMAGVLRNLSSISTNNFEVPGLLLHSRHIKQHSGRKMTSDIHDAAVSDFHLSKPEGKFAFRDMDNKLHISKIDNLSDLGESLLATPDLYTCMVSKYYQHFTGVSFRPSLSDKNDNKNGHYKFIRKEANLLKKHGNLKRTILNILNSEVYAQEYYSIQ